MTDFSKKAQMKKTQQPTPGKMTKSERKAYCDFIFNLSNGMCQCGCGKAIDNFHHSKRGAYKDDRSLTGISMVCHTLLHFSTDSEQRKALTKQFKKIGEDNWEENMTSIRLNMRGMATPRPRMGKHGVYNKSKYTDYKKALQIYFRSFKKYEAPKQLEIEVSFFFVTPKGYKRTKYQVPNLDVDNALKGILDAGNNILYDDDMQVVKATVTKKYADVDCIFISIKETAIKKSLHKVSHF